MCTISERIAYLEAVVGADITQFRKSMRDIRTETGILSDVIGGISGAAKTMTYAFTVPMVALGTYAVQAAATFDASMRNINSIALLTEPQLAALSKRTLEFGKNTRSGATEASKALYEVFSAGILNVDDAFNIMQVSVKTAEAGVADLTETTKGLTAAALTFGDQSPKAMQRYSDATELAVQLGVGSMNTFNTGIQNVMGTGQLLGVTFEDLAANVAYMSQRGVNFASAGTYMNNALSKLIKPGKELTDVFKQLQVHTGNELIAKFGGIEGALRAIYNQVGNSPQVWAKLFPDVRGFKAIAKYVDQFSKDGKDSISSFFTNFDDKMKAGGVTTNAWEQQMMSFNATVDHAKSALQGVAIVIGQAIMPMITPIIQKFTEFMNTLSDTNPQVISMAVGFVAVVAAAAPVVWLLTSMINPVGLLLGAVTALSVAFTTNFGGIQDTVKRTVSSILGDVTPLTAAFTDFWKQVFPAMPTSASQLTGGTKLTISTKDVITVDKPESLWQLYKDNGYDKMFSWDEFVKDAKAGGWSGKALKVGDVIELPNPQAFQEGARNITSVATSLGGVSSKLQALADQDTGAIQTKFSFFENLSNAIATTWPKVQTALAGLWQNISGWVIGTGLPALDRIGSQILTSITGWFNPTQRSGNTESYQAIRQFIGGGAQHGAEQGVQLLQNTFPKIAAGLRGMIDSVGAWIMTEGVPTVSRSIGYLVGTVGVKFGELLGNLGNFLSGGGAGDAANGVKTAVVDPAVQGFNNAMKDNKVKAGADQFFTGLAAVFVASAGIAVFGQILMGKGLISAVWGTLSAVLSGGASVASGAVGMGGKIINGLLNTSMGADLANKMNNIGGSIMSALSDALSTAATTATSLFSKVASPIMTAISGALETKALQSMLLWDKVTGAIGGALTSAMAAITPLTTWVLAAVAPIGTAIMGGIAAVIAAAPALPVILAGIAIVGLLSLVLPDSVKQKFSDLFNAVLGDGTQTMKPELAAPIQATVDQLQVDIAPTALNLAADATISQIQGFLTDKLQGTNISPKDQDIAVKLDKLVVDYNAGAIDQAALENSTTILINAAYADIQTVVKPPITVDPQVAPLDNAKAKTMADGMLNPLWTQVAANIAAENAVGGNTDTTVMAAGMTKPFVDQFTTSFGTTGTVTTKWQEFVSTVNNGMNTTNNKLIETGIHVGLFSAGTIMSNTLAIASFNGYNLVKDKLAAVRQEAEKLQNTLGALVAHSPYEITINVKTNGTVPTVSGTTDTTAGKSHAGGLDNVPYDGYKATLHQNEAVLTPMEASVWRNMPRILAHMRKPRSEGNSQPQNNTIIINGVQDVDTMLKELKRRGIQIGNQR